LSEANKPSPYAAALKGRCPKCGEGRLYAGYLKLAERCESCGLELGAYDQADGPAVFVMFIVGFLVVIPMLVVELVYHPPYWVHAMLWTPWTVILVMALLRPIKSLLVAQQFVHKAEEATFKE
jgi:uncharacterized protein (DUF983 family)